MNENKEIWYENIEEPYDLFKEAQHDIMSICDTIESKRFNPEARVGRICRFATESVEKMLKGWIINANDHIKVYGIHDLGKLYIIIIEMNNSFSELEHKLIKLNNYTPKLRYNSRTTIEKHEIKECLETLKYIYDFSLIKGLRDKINTENVFNELPDDINILFGEYKKQKALDETKVNTN
jgi:HEPN domain-containing protein